jgi:hypothetical protein
MTGRLWTVLLLLAGVLAVHGLQCAADGGHGATHVPAASVVLTTLSTGHADAAPAVTALVAPASGEHTSATTTATAGDRGTGAPHESAGHLWTACLAVLAAAFAVLLAVLLARPAQLLRQALAHARARLGSLAPPRPPDLSVLCLLRI